MKVAARRVKTWDFILSIAGVFAALLTLAASFYLSDRVTHALNWLQSQNSAARVGAVLQAFDQNVHHLADYTTGYAMWDDTYQYLETKDPAYLETNYAEPVMAVSPVQLAALYDLRGNLLFAASLNEDRKTIPVPPGLADLPRLKGFSQLHKPGDFRSRVEWVGDNAYLIAVCPVTDSAGTAPVRGYLLFGTIIGPKMLKRVEMLTGVRVQVDSSGSALRPSLEIATTDLGSAQVSIQESDDFDNSTAQAIFKRDNDEQPAVVFNMELPARTSQMGRQLNRTIWTAFGAVGLALILFIVLSIREMRFRRREILQRVIERDQLQRARETAEAADRAKSAFLAMMSHEIRTPLNAIIGYAGLLQASPAEDREERLSIIARSSGMLQRILDDILDFSKIEAGKLDLHPRPTSLGRLVNDLVAVFQNQAHLRGNQIQSTMADDVPALLSLDEVRLRQVLSNLLSNAIKFTESGTISIFVDGAPDDGDVYHLRIRVEDEGIGIARDKEKMLFQPFSQADSTASRQYEGTGLGLAICHRICGLMGGEIRYDRREPKGSVFTICLPAAIAKAPSDEAAEMGAAADQADDLSILVVDDNAVNARLMKAILLRIGRTAEVAHNGEAAIAMYRNKRHDLIFMDIHMPGMDGLETTQAIRRIEQEEDLPATHIVAVTADTLVASSAQSMAAGMDGHLNKPIQQSQIESVIARFAKSASA